MARMTVEEKREYDRQRYLANREETKARARDRYWADPDKAKRYQKRYHTENPELVAERKRRYTQENREAHNERNRRWKLNNPEKVAATNRNWKQANPTKHAETERRRAALKRGSAVERIEYAAVWERDAGVCGLCGERVDDALQWPHPQSGSIDHIVPIVAGGPHTYDNTQLAHLRCNISKGARHVA